MNQKDRELILKDLTARLRYGVKILHETWNYEWDQEMSLLERVVGIDEDFVYVKVVDEHNGEEYRDDKIPISTFDDKMFLRPMSSMTEKEDKEFALLQTEAGNSGFLYPSNAANLMKFLNANHLDYNGLIEKGLALPAPEGMYNN
jgi:hypothetical protein